MIRFFAVKCHRIGMNTNRSDPEQIPLLGTVNQCLHCWLSTCMFAMLIIQCFDTI